ncbi:hypothetical protein STEG23_011622, partial [Scotinomys teguina]
MQCPAEKHFGRTGAFSVVSMGKADKLPISLSVSTNSHAQGFAAQAVVHKGLKEYRAPGDTTLGVSGSGASLLLHQLPVYTVYPNLQFGLDPEMLFAALPGFVLRVATLHGLCGERRMLD